MPAYHHGVELETLLAAGVKPVFFRIDAQMRCDFEDARRRATPEVRALYVIHYAGFPQDMEAARQLASELGVPLIEDCALSLFSAEGDLPLGVTGDVAIFCLYKVMAMPDGGVLEIQLLAVENAVLHVRDAAGLAGAPGDGDHFGREVACDHGSRASSFTALIPNRSNMVLSLATLGLPVVRSFSPRKTELAPARKQRA